MKYVLLIYIDPELLQSLPPHEYDAQMRSCLVHADALQAQGTLLMAQKLQPARRPCAAARANRGSSMARLLKPARSWPAST